MLDFDSSSRVNSAGIDVVRVKALEAHRGYVRQHLAQVRSESQRIRAAESADHDASIARLREQRDKWCAVDTWIVDEAEQRRLRASLELTNAMTNGLATYAITLQRFSGQVGQKSPSGLQPIAADSTAVAFAAEDPVSVLARMWASGPPSTEGLVAAIRQRRRAADRSRYARERRAARAALNETVIATALSESCETAAQLFTLQSEVAAERSLARNAQRARRSKAARIEHRRGATLSSLAEGAKARDGLEI